MTMTERQIAIMKLLSASRKVTVNQLAAEFDVHPRTIKRDLMTLSLSYPLYVMPGPAGGVFLSDGYYFGEQTFLLSEEVEVLKELKSVAGDDQRRVIDSILARFQKPQDTVRS